MKIDQIQTTRHEIEIKLELETGLKRKISLKAVEVIIYHVHIEDRKIA